MESAPVPKYSEVFVPGGFPRHTYNPRSTQQLEARLEEVKENLCKLVTVTGHTKLGKTVLVRTVFPSEECLWIDGGTIGSEDDFWNTIANQLELFQATSISKGSSSTTGIAASVTGSANFVIVKGESEVEVSLDTQRTEQISQSRSVSTKIAAINALKLSKIPLIIDDFHYLQRDTQGLIVRSLKQIVFDGSPVVIIAIPHRRYDALKVEREMTGRIMPVEVPSWSEEELRFIPETGFPKLQIEIDAALSSRLALEAIGSPHLMQEFCRAICRQNIVKQTPQKAVANPDDAQLELLFRDVADSIGRPIFEKLARGPRQRADRIQRTLASGATVDIYGLVLNALAHLRPGLVTLKYEDLRTAIRDVSAKDPPQLHEVARVLKHMAEIAATDQSSVPVLEFDEQDKLLHITDPFFAFYLRWGDLNG
jgi:hypothetical protein